MRHLVASPRLRRLGPSTKASRRRNGFTLIETLAAFTILILVMSNLLQGVGAGARNESYGEFLLNARRDADSQLQSLGVTEPIVPGVQTGTYTDGLQWTLSIDPYRAAGTTQGDKKILGYLTRLIVRRAGAERPQSMTFTTLKIVEISERPR
jgi:general secretion pathway protein I